MKADEIVEIIEALIEKHRTDVCTGCAFVSREAWEEPCKMCRRATIDYYRREWKTDGSD